MNVFFYGLFMDETLLAKKGISPNKSFRGYVNGFMLRIGERATLLPTKGARSYGVVMDITTGEGKDLYAESSVADYVAEPVTVTLLNGKKTEAICYNLPANKVTGTNKKYVKALLGVAARLDFPDSYLDQIKQAGD